MNVFTLWVNIVTDIQHHCLYLRVDLQCPLSAMWGLWALKTQTALGWKQWHPLVLLLPLVLPDSSLSILSCVSSNHSPWKVWRHKRGEPFLDQRDSFPALVRDCTKKKGKNRDPAFADAEYKDYIDQPPAPLTHMRKPLVSRSLATLMWMYVAQQCPEWAGPAAEEGEARGAAHWDSAVCSLPVFWSHWVRSEENEGVRGSLLT